MSTFSFPLENEAATISWAQHLAGVLPQQPTLVYLHGNLGSGKTTLSRALIQALGHNGSVKSPTYSLLEPYAELPWPVYHLDLYRLSDPEELEYLGLRDIIGNNALILIEWPDRGAGWLPAADLVFHLESEGVGRRLDVDVKQANLMSCFQQMKTITE